MVLQTENLTKYYGRFCALEDLNLEIAPGEIFGLLGPNGSGKSTALRMMLGFLRPTTGNAWIEGYECWDESMAVRRLVSYLPGELRLYENMTGKRLLRFLGRLRGGMDENRINQLAGDFDIDLSRPIANLSSGMKRKLALISVLAPETKLLILDEPTNTLDPTMRDALLDQLRMAHQRGQTVLFSSHVLSEVEAVCNRVGILQRGRLVHLQTIAEMQQRRRIVVEFDSVPDRIPDLPGATVVHFAENTLIMETDNSLSTTLQWLGKQAIRNLNIETTGLSSIYHRYHGPEV